MVPKSAHFPLTSMFHSIYAKLHIGDPSQRHEAFIVRQKALLSNGA
jgi:hypothetical protein